MNDFNLELHNKVIAQIEREPDTWDQFIWHEGNCRCYGSWARELSGPVIDHRAAHLNAKRVLGLTTPEAVYAFDPDRTLEELRNLPEYIKSNRENPK